MYNESLPVVRISDVVHLPEVSDILTSAADLVDALAGVRHARVVAGAPGTRPLCGVRNESAPTPRLVTSPAPGLANLRPRPHPWDWSTVRIKACD